MDLVNSYIFNAEANTQTTYESYTKPECKKLTGVYFEISGVGATSNGYSDFKSTIDILVDNKSIFGIDIHAVILTKNNAKDINELIHSLDIDVKNSHVKIFYNENRGSDYPVGVNLIFEK